MNKWIALILALGVAAFAYNKLGRRAGYGNEKSIYGVVLVAFIITFVIIYTLLQFVFHLA